MLLRVEPFAVLDTFCPDIGQSDDGCAIKQEVVTTAQSAKTGPVSVGSNLPSTLYGFAQP